MHHFGHPTGKANNSWRLFSGKNFMTGLERVSADVVRLVPMLRCLPMWIQRWNPVGWFDNLRMMQSPTITAQQMCRQIPETDVLNCKWTETPGRAGGLYASAVLDALLQEK